MLLADPSELRKQSRLPLALRKAAAPCKFLEERTGADLLVSTLNLPATSDKLLRRHCQDGLLIQRKTAGDFAASITDGRLYRSLHKMLQWSPHPWLAVVGRIENRNGYGFVDGVETLQYNALMGALDYWQLRGGYYSILSNDDGFARWVLKWPERLEAVAANPEHIVTRTPSQELLEDNRVGFLAMLPGLGRGRARALLDASASAEDAEGQGGNLARALCIVTNRHGSGVRGIGEGTVKSVRDWLSIGEGQQLAVVDERLLADMLEGAFDWMEADPAKAAPLYAHLADWLGLPCTEAEDGWRGWLKEVLDG